MKELLERAEAPDTSESNETLDIPAELARREKRVAALKQARAVIEARAREMAKARQPEYEAKQAARQAQRDAGKKPRGKEPVPPSEERRDGVRSWTGVLGDELQVSAMPLCVNVHDVVEARIRWRRLGKGELLEVIHELVRGFL